MHARVTVLLANANRLKVWSITSLYSVSSVGHLKTLSVGGWHPMTKISVIQVLMT